MTLRNAASWGVPTYPAGVAGRCAIGERQARSGACISRRRAKGGRKDGGAPFEAELIGSGARPYSPAPARRARPRSPSSKASTSRAGRTRSPGNCAARRASPACADSRAGTKRRWRCSPRSSAGSRKASTRPICRPPARCSMNWPAVPAPPQMSRQSLLYPADAMTARPNGGFLAHRHHRPRG